MARLLKKMDLTPQKPLRRAYQQDKERIERWLKEEYLRIRQMALEEAATFYFVDEAAVRSDYHSGTTWAPRGKTPVVESTSTRFSVNMISAITAKGFMRFIAIEGRLNADKFIEFLERLIYSAERPIYLIVDMHPTHEASKVKKFVDSTNGRLKLFHLPPYSPELNPDELLWNHVKNHRIGRKQIKVPDDLKRKVIACLRSLQRMPKKIIGFFKEPHVSYAAI